MIESEKITLQITIDNFVISSANEQQEFSTAQKAYHGAYAWALLLLLKRPEREIILIQNQLEIDRLKSQGAFILNTKSSFLLQKILGHQPNIFEKRKFPHPKNLSNYELETLIRNSTEAAENGFRKHMCGELAERRVLEIVFKLSSVSFARRASKAEDHQGIDLIVDLKSSTQILIQIKSSRLNKQARLELQKIKNKLQVNNIKLLRASYSDSEEKVKNRLIKILKETSIS